MSDLVKFKLEITMPKRWIKKFIQMLDCMRWTGRVGSSRLIAFYADGDGDFRPFDFKINGKEFESKIKWSEHDKTWKPSDDYEIPPKFKTRRNEVDFFFDAG